MSKLHEAVDDLVDYEEEEVIIPEANSHQASATPAKDAKGDVKKGSYVGIHSTGFRDFLLKPELLRAISDCGFEHPSEGLSWRCGSPTTWLIQH